MQALFSPMRDRIHISAAATTPACADTALDAALVAESGLPRSSVRRLSRMGLQAAVLLNRLAADGTQPVVLASSHAESRSLEAFLDSFPTPSPLRFQTSVHPSSVQQARVALQAPLRTYIPLCGGEWLALTALRTALQLPAARVILMGGEEAGTWLTGVGLASLASFGFGLLLSDSPEGAVGSVRWCQGPGESGDSASLWDVFQAVERRQEIAWGHPEIGFVQIEWS